MKKLLALIFLTATFAQAQWFAVGKGGGTFTAKQGTTFRYGSGASTYAFDCSDPALCGTHKAGDASAAAWSPSKTVQADGPFVGGDDFFGGDPIYDVYKEVDVLQTSAPQTVVYAAADGSPAVTLTVPALALAATGNSCSADNTACTKATPSDSAMIISTAGSVALSSEEVATLKAAIQAAELARAAVQQANANLQTVQQTIAANRKAVAPYQIVTDFSLTIEQVPPAPVAITSTPQ